MRRKKIIDGPPEIPSLEVEVKPVFKGYDRPQPWNWKRIICWFLGKTFRRPKDGLNRGHKWVEHPYIDNHGNDDGLDVCSRCGYA